jgi:hypothetical protein
MNWWKASSKPGKSSVASAHPLEIFRQCRDDQTAAQDKLSQAKFEALLRVEVSTLRNWEQGRREPTGLHTQSSFGTNLARGAIQRGISKSHSGGIDQNSPG